MQPTLCSKCKKNVAVVFISRQNEKGEMVNEGLCLKCAAQLGLPQVEEMMKKMGISPEDLENINNEMMQAFGGAEELSDMTEAQDDDGDDDEESGNQAGNSGSSLALGSRAIPHNNHFVQRLSIFFHIDTNMFLLTDNNRFRPISDKRYFNDRFCRKLQFKLSFQISNGTNSCILYFYRSTDYRFSRFVKHHTGNVFHSFTLLLYTYLV